MARRSRSATHVPDASDGNGAAMRPAHRCPDVALCNTEGCNPQPRSSPSRELRAPGLDLLADGVVVRRRGGHGEEGGRRVEDRDLPGEVVLLAEERGLLPENRESPGGRDGRGSARERADRVVYPVGVVERGRVA